MSRAPLWPRLWQDERGFIGTSAAIALSIAAAAGAGAQVHGAKSAAGQNRRAMEATERSDVRAGERDTAALEETRRQHEADLARQIAEDERVERARQENLARQIAEDERVERNRQDTLARQRTEDARAEQARQDRLGFAREQWSGYLGAQQPHWRLGTNVLGRLSDLAGGNLSGGGAVDMRQYLASLPTSGGAPGGAGGGVPVRGAGAARVVPSATLMSPTTPVRDPGLATPPAGASRSVLPSMDELMQLASLMPTGRAGTRRLPSQAMSLSDYYAAAQALPAV